MGPALVGTLAVVREVIEVEREERPVEADEPPELVDVRTLAVRSEPHHLAFVAVVREAEPLRDRRVEEPERVREEHAAEHLELVTAAVREHRRREVAAA